jgi:membrane-associated phospholipid phosphatase
VVEILKSARPPGPQRIAIDARFWPVDMVILAYLTFTAALLVGWFAGIRHAPWWLAWHVGSVALLVYEVKRPNPTSWIFRYWYPLPYVGISFKEMASLIPAVRGSDADRALADLDYRLWGVHPTVWLERVSSPALTEFLQIAYTLFIPAVLMVAVLLWRRRQYRDFQYYAFLIALGFLVSYVGYLLVPARGPRFLLAHLQHTPLSGLWLFGEMQTTLDRLESAHYDCFPSGHTELTILAWWGSRMLSRRWFRAYFFYTPFLIFATVYLRYHYTVDVLAGAVVAFLLILAAPAVYRTLVQGAHAFGRHRSYRDGE